MSELPTYRPANRTTATAADVNGLFTGIGTSTSAINDANVRSQGVDIAQVDTTTIDNNGRVTRFVGQYDDTTATTRTSGSTQTVATWGPIVMPLNVGHTLRLSTSFVVTDISVSDPSGAGGQTAATKIADMSYFVGSGWLFYLEWDITDATLSNFVPVPGQDDFGTYIAGINDSAGNPVPHVRTAQTSSTMLVPHVYVSRDIVGGTDSVLNPVSGQFGQPIRRTRTFRYTRSGTNATVYGFRLRCRGIVSLGIDPAATGDGLFFVRDTVLYTSGGGAPWTDNAWTNESITINPVSFRALVQDPQ